jgi:hypothetical protein
MTGTYISPACTATSTAQSTVGDGLPDRRGREHQADSAGSGADMNSLAADLQQDGFVMGGITTPTHTTVWYHRKCGLLNSVLLVRVLSLAGQISLVTADL